MNPFSIREATVADIAGILAVQKQSEGAPCWDESAWMGILAKEGTARKVYVVLRDEALLGFGVASGVHETAELESIAISPSSRRQHLGRWLCRGLMVWGLAQDCTTMELEVRASNHAAQELYRSMGFEEHGKRPNYYRDPEEDAVLMAAKL